MKEKIYTIPVNEAYDTDCECPLCHLEKQLETKAIDYALGAAMMEPDYRMESNEKGCHTYHGILFNLKGANSGTGSNVYETGGHHAK